LRSEQALLEVGLRVLIEVLGYADTLRFLAQFSDTGVGDSVAWQQALFKDVSVDGLYEQSSAFWQQQNTQSFDYAQDGHATRNNSGGTDDPTR